MRDAGGTILYIGKAKSLRKRLASYRVANPDRLRRRQLRLLRAVERIEWQECPDEASALAKEAGLLRSVRPRFNRAGTWPAPVRFLGWRLTGEGLHLQVAEASEPDWHCHGPLGSGAYFLRSALLRLLWCAIHHEAGLDGLPPGSLTGRLAGIMLVPRRDGNVDVFHAAAERLDALFAGDGEPLAAWVRDRTGARQHPFEIAAREADLETVLEFAQRHATA